MSWKPNKPNGKSPYQRTNSAARGRSWMLVVTVVILLIGAAAWVSTYTRAVATTAPGATAPVIDPGLRQTGTQSGTTSSER